MRSEPRIQSVDGSVDSSRPVDSSPVDHSRQWWAGYSILFKTSKIGEKES
jgi:hypothetical protein